MRQIMVLNDGKTFGNLNGCSIMTVPNSFDIEDINEALDILNRSGEAPEGVSVVTVFQDLA